jgi:UDP-N-acetylmuramyl pentapeptide phosphotransferase/UDP-N-acetylglucosamine-1-phosphate transferase
MVFSGCLVWHVLHVGVIRIDLPFSVYILSTNIPGSVAFASLASFTTDGGVVTALEALPWFLLTMLALVTITNGINLIDGLNGLASFSTITMLLGLGAVAFTVGDNLIAPSAFVLAGSVAGFFIWNWPRGYLFLGDGGAYLLGCLLGVLAIALVQRNASVSAWFAVLLLAYPLMEVAFSVWRRRLVKGRPAGLPDASHLHHLIYRRLIRITVGKSPAESRLMRNAFAAPYLWIMNSFAVFPAVAFFDQAEWLVACLLAFVGTYISFYLRIVKLKSPKILIVRDPFRQVTTPSSM